MRSPRRPAHFDVHWLRSMAFTIVLVGLVAAAIGDEWPITVGAVVTCAVAFGFFYLLFPGGAHFGMTVANLLAIYICRFEFCRGANFTDVPRWLAVASLALPVGGFLAGCFFQRRRVLGII